MLRFVADKLLFPGESSASRWGAAAVLVIDALLLLAMWVQAPHMLSPASLTKDAKGYYIRGLNLKEHAVFSAVPEEPRFPDIVRSPGFPVVVGMFTTRNSLLPVFLLQAVLDASTCLLVGRLAGKLGGATAEWWAVAFYAINPGLRLATLSVMSECLFNFGLMLSITVICRLMQDPVDQIRPSRLLMNGFLLALLTLVRPTGKYVLVLAAMMLLAVCWRRDTVAGIAGKLLALFLGFTLGVGGWIARNQAVFGYPVISAIDDLSFVYYVGGGGFAVQRQLEFSEARDLLAEELQIPLYTKVINPQPPAKMRSDLERIHSVRRDVVTRYPVALLKSLGIGLVRGLLAHDADSLAEIFGTRWKPSGLFSGAKRGKQAAEGNSLWLVASAIVMTAVNALMVCLGLLACVSRVTWQTARSVFCALVSGMFLALVMGFGIAAYSRSRMPLIPILCVVGAVALADRLGRRRRTVPPLSPSLEQPTVVA